MRNRRNKKQLHSLTVGVRTQLCKECQDMQTRRCVADGEPAFFHRWVDDEQTLLQLHTFTKEEHAFKIRQQVDDHRIVPYCAEIKPLKQTFALVEMLDGSVKKVAPEKVRFCDREEAE